MLRVYESNEKSEKEVKKQVGTYSIDGSFQWSKATGDSDPPYAEIVENKDDFQQKERRGNNKCQQIAWFLIKLRFIGGFDDGHRDSIGGHVPIFDAPCKRTSIGRWPIGTRHVTTNHSIDVENHSIFHISGGME